MKNCAVCGAEFEGHFNKKYCDDLHCQNWKREKTLAKEREYAMRPENKAKRQAYQKSERFKKQRREYLKRPEVKRRINNWAKDYQPQWVAKNRKKTREYTRNYRKNNPQKVKESTAKTNKKRMRKPSNVISNRIRTQIHKHLKLRGLSKGGKTFALLGYTGTELYNHLQSQFTESMSWDNMGEWHIDHIRPVSSFDYDSTEHPDFKKCWALNNLQPLWAQDNLNKNNKWDGIINA